MGRVAHLHVLDVASGRVADLFEGTGPRAAARRPRRERASTSRPTAGTSSSRSILRRRSASTTAGRWPRSTSRSGKIATAARSIPAWDFDAPRYSPDGRTDRLPRQQHQAAATPRPPTRALLERGGSLARAHRRLGPRGRRAPALVGRRRARSASPPRIAAAAISGASRSTSASAAIAAEGGWVHWFDVAGDTARHCRRRDAPSGARACAPRRRQGRCASSASTTSCSTAAPRPRCEERVVTGAQRRAGADVARLSARLRREGKKYPVLHSIHGGPHAAAGDTFHYRWNNQLFAAQGYVVACVNYHGSSGFGNAFLDSITHRWGELELQDVEAGDRLAAEATVGRQAPRLRHRRQLRRLHGRVDERPREARPLPGLRLPRRLLRLACRCSPTTPTPGTRASSARAYWEDPAKIQSQSPDTFAAHDARRRRW